MWEDRHFPDLIGQRSISVSRIFPAIQEGGKHVTEACSIKLVDLFIIDYQLFNKKLITCLNIYLFLAYVCNTNEINT